MTKEELKTISDTARILSARQPGTSTVAMTLEAAMVELAASTPTSGGVGNRHWVAAARSFGEILVSIAKREDAKLRAIGI